LLQGCWTLPHSDTAFEEEAADPIDDSRALADKAGADAVEREKIALLGRLDRNEVHGRSLHGLGDGLGIAEVVLVSLKSRVIMVISLCH